MYEVEQANLVFLAGIFYRVADFYRFLEQIDQTPNPITMTYSHVTDIKLSHIFNILELAVSGQSGKIKRLELCYLCMAERLPETPGGILVAPNVSPDLNPNSH